MLRPKQALPCIRLCLKILNQLMDLALSCQLTLRIMELVMPLVSKES